MTRAVCIAIAALAACHEPGVVIEVHRGDTRAERVELFLADDPCILDGTTDDVCPSLATPSANQHLDGQIYTRDYAAPFTAEIDGDGVAYFRLEADGKHTSVLLAAAVGYEGSELVAGTLIEREIDATKTQRWIVTLEELEDAVVDGSRSGGDGLYAEVWRQDEGVLGTCLAVERRHGDSAERTFFVPREDKDCDDHVGPAECDAMWPDKPANSAQARPFTCVVEEPDVLGASMCLLGTSACADGEGQTECAAKSDEAQQKWCVPSSLCEAPLVGCEGADEGCLYGHLKHPELHAELTRLHCTVPIEPAGTGNRICGGNQREAIYDTGPQDLDCAGVGLGPVTATGIGPFTTITPNVGISVGPSCDITLAFSGQFQANETHLLQSHVVKVDFLHGFSVIVPLDIELVPTSPSSCIEAEATCTLVTMDGSISADPSLTACATRP